MMTSKARKLANVLSDNALNALDVTGFQETLDAQNNAIQQQLSSQNTAINATLLTVPNTGKVLALTIALG